ncbi:MAG TPA: phage holin family protein [Acidimicrobiales bacterium]|nr:phage holin family protein [Acidimicrobiales bacterium]
MAPAQRLERRPLQAQRHDDRTLQQLWSDITSQTGTLLRQEVELAKIETKEELSRAAKAGVLFSVAGVSGLLTLVLVSFAAAWGLAAVMPEGLAFLLVGLLYAVVTAVLLSRARKRAAEIDLPPRQTVETLKEDVQWARALRR